MGKLQLTFMTRNWDSLAPLTCGDVAPEGIDLRLVRDDEHPLELGKEEAFDGGEASFCKTVIAHSNGNRRWVPIPLFLGRGFTLRRFLVPRESPLRSLADLRRMRVGLENWRTSGSTWCRAAVREAGVPWDEVEWHVGPLGAGASRQPQGDLPRSARLLPEGRGLQEMVLKGDLDAIFCWRTPPGFYEPDFPLARLIPDYPRAEEQYLRRVGFCPGMHLLHIRRELVQGNEWVLSSLYAAFDRSMRMAQDSRRARCETTPWLLAEIEHVTELFGQYWWTNGLTANTPNRKMMDVFCDEVFIQGLTTRRVSVDELFAEFISATEERPVASLA